MKVTVHAGERFLQRVFNKNRYSQLELMRAIKLLERETDNIVFNECRKNLLLPSFNNFVAVIKNQTIVKIINKQKVKISKY